MHVADAFLHKSVRRRVRGDKHWAGEIHEPHSCILGPNLHCESKLSDNFFESFSSPKLGGVPSCSFPIPFGPPTDITKTVLNGLDPARKLVKDKVYFNRRLEKLLKDNTVPIDTLLQQLIDMESSPHHIELDQTIVAIAEHLSKDPDPHFKADFNCWQGNALEMVIIGGESFVIRPSGYCSNTLTATRTQTNDYCIPVSNSHHEHGLSETNPIFHIESCSDLLLLRQEQLCGIFRLQCEVPSELVIKKLSTVFAESSFIKSCFNKFNPREFVTLDPCFIMKVNDVSTDCKSKQTVDLKFLKNEDCQCSVHWHDENVLVFCNQTTANFVDLRKPTSEFNKVAWSIESKTESCETIYTAVKGSYLHYISTKHNLLGLDPRKGWFERWTHGLPTSPSLLIVKANVDNDLLLAGCSASGYIASIRNTGQFSSVLRKPPYRLPSVEDTLHLARLSGLCLSPIIKPRFSLTMTGLTLLQLSDQLYVLSLTSIGDVFVQKMNLDESSLGEQGAELTTYEFDRMAVWDSACIEQYLSTKKEIKATKMINSKNLAKLYNSSCKLDVVSTPRKALGKQPWMISKRRLLKYQDCLAQPLLSVWNLDDDDEWLDDSDAEENYGEEGDSNSEFSD